MNLVSFWYDKDLKLLLQFPVFIKPYTENLWHYQEETAHVPIKDNNTEANSCTLQQPREECLAVTEEKYIYLTSAALSTGIHIGHEYFDESLILVKHKTSQICKSPVFYLSFPQKLLIAIMIIISFTK